MKVRPASQARKSLALSLASAIVLSGCLSTTETQQQQADEEQHAAEQRAQTPATLLWQSEEELASDVLMLEDVVLSYTHDSGKLQLTARDLETGQLLWEKDARPGADPSGMSLALRTVTHNEIPTVAILEPIDAAHTRVAVINAQTGQTITSWADDYWGYRPAACDDTWCLEGINNPSYQDHTWRERQLNWDTGKWNLVDPATLQTPKLPDSRYLGEGLSSTSDRGPGEEQLVFAKDGQIKWQHPYEQIFDSRYSSDSGWQWKLLHDPSRTLIGSGSRAYAIASDSTYLLDWSKDFMTVGLSETTGEVLWRHPGSQADCSGALARWVFDERRTMILCQIDNALGTVSAESGGTREQNITGLAWRVTAIDTFTGREHWSHQMPELERYRELMEEERTIVSDNEHAYLPMSQGWSAVEISSGEIKEPAQVYDQIVLCAQARDSIKFEDPHHDEGQYVRIPVATEPCALDGLAPEQSPPTYGEFLRAGYENKDIVALSGPNGMLVYRMPKSPASAE